MLLLAILLFVSAAFLFISFGMDRPMTTWAIYRWLMKKLGREYQIIGEDFEIKMTKPSLATSYEGRYCRLFALDDIKLRSQGESFRKHVREAVLLINKLELEECFGAQEMLQSNVNLYESNLQKIYHILESEMRHNRSMKLWNREMSYLTKAEVQNLYEANGVIEKRVKGFRKAVRKRALNKLSENFRANEWTEFDSAMRLVGSL